jgi:hypothetical protein
MLVVVLLLPLSSAMYDYEFNNGGDSGGGGGLAAAAAGGGCGGWRWGRSMAAAAWQCSTAAMDYGEAMVRGRWHLAVVVASDNGD